MTRSKEAARAILCAGLLVAGCGGSDGGVDVGPASDGAAASLEVGTGRDGFEPFEDGATLGLVHGTQGLQHVYVSLRSQGLEPRGAIVELSLVRDRDGVTVSKPFEVRLSFTPVEGEAYADIWGLILVIEAPDEALGEDLTLEASVVDAADRKATDSRPVRVDWAS